MEGAPSSQPTGRSSFRSGIILLKRRSRLLTIERTRGPSADVVRSEKDREWCKGIASFCRALLAGETRLYGASSSAVVFPLDLGLVDVTWRLRNEMPWRCRRRRFWKGWLSLRRCRGGGSDSPTGRGMGVHCDRIDPVQTWLFKRDECISRGPAGNHSVTESQRPGRRWYTVFGLLHCQ